MGEHKLAERVKGHGWRERDMRAMVARSADELGAMRQLALTGTRMFDKGSCKVLVSQEPRPNKGTRTWWHLSISCENRYPTWDEIKDARYSLLPMGLYFAQILPPMNEFVNIHPNCFHVWEIDSSE